MNTKIKELDTVCLKDNPNIVFGVRKIDYFRNRKGLYVYGQNKDGNIIVPYSDVVLVCSKHKR